MSTCKLLELWAPPAGFRLASIIATTYECQADFVEEDLLPMALNLRLPAARGRDFRIELEHALQDVEVTVFLHPERYQAGLRRSPRIDLVPLPENRYPKLHAKVALLRFVPEVHSTTDKQVVRLVVGSANLTNSGYRSNLELAIALDDSPGSTPTVITAVRDATAWLRELLGQTTEQCFRQLRDFEAVFASRPTVPVRNGLRFVGLPRTGGLVGLLTEHNRGPAKSLTLVSPFWPTGEEPTDIVNALGHVAGGLPPTIRLIGPAEIDDQGRDIPGHPSSPYQDVSEKQG